MTTQDRVQTIAALIGAPVRRVRPLSGGDLSTVLRCTLADGRDIIAKCSGRPHVEAEMLRAIAASGVPTPTVLALSETILLIEALPSTGSLERAWDDLARQLTRLHAVTGPRYGWPVDAAFGPVAIANGWSDDWPAFWAEHRLLCHLPHLRAGLARRVERLADRTHDLLPARPAPSLLHGDLWGGNILLDDTRVSGLIDPACYYGHREVDWAMLTLFDRPPARFFDAMTPEPEWRERLALYRLWPLLVHVRLFGGGYEASAAQELDRLGF